ncbi:MAG: hypothetical protein PVJ50_08780 [Desulfobacterales bacterium]|jgi:hypothetical protein
MSSTVVAETAVISNEVLVSKIHRAKSIRYRINLTDRLDSHG